LKILRYTHLLSLKLPQSTKMEYQVLLKKLLTMRLQKELMPHLL